MGVIHIRANSPDLVLASMLTFIFQTYSVRRVEMGESRSVYVTLAFAGVALMVGGIVDLLFHHLAHPQVAMLIGVVVLRKRSSRFPSHQVTPFFSLQETIFNPHKLPQEPCYDFPQEHTHNLSHEHSC